MVAQGYAIAYQRYSTNYLQQELTAKALKRFERAYILLRG
jgi:hypothetical protein